MKKILVFVLCFSFVFVLSSCSLFEKDGVITLSSNEITVGTMDFDYSTIIEYSNEKYDAYLLEVDDASVDYDDTGKYSVKFTITEDVEDGKSITETESIKIVYNYALTSDDVTNPSIHEVDTAMQYRLEAEEFIYIGFSVTDPLQVLDFKLDSNSNNSLILYYNDFYLYQEIDNDEAFSGPSTTNPGTSYGTALTSYSSYLVSYTTDRYLLDEDGIMLPIGDYVLVLKNNEAKTTMTTLFIGSNTIEYTATLIGNEVEVINLGSTYTDPGINFLDSEGNRLEYTTEYLSSVGSTIDSLGTISNKTTLNTSSTGDTYIAYLCEDLLLATRTVRVVDADVAGFVSEDVLLNINSSLIAHGYDVWAKLLIKHLDNGMYICSSNNTAIIAYDANGYYLWDLSISLESSYEFLSTDSSIIIASHRGENYNTDNMLYEISLEGKLLNQCEIDPIYYVEDVMVIANEIVFYHVSGNNVDINVYNFDFVCILDKTVTLNAASTMYEELDFTTFIQRDDDNSDDTETFYMYDKYGLQLDTFGVTNSLSGYDVITLVSIVPRGENYIFNFSETGGGDLTYVTGTYDTATKTLSTLVTYEPIDYTETVQSFTDGYYINFDSTFSKYFLLDKTIKTFSFEGLTDESVLVDAIFDPLDGVTINNSNGDSINNSVTISSILTAESDGTYILTDAGTYIFIYEVTVGGQHLKISREVTVS